MDRERAEDLYEKLLELARRPGTAAEGENAARFAAELKAKFQLEDPPPSPSAPGGSWGGSWFTKAWDEWRAETGIFMRPPAGAGVISKEPPSFAGRDDEIDRS